jgi:hypothetical protein
MLADAARISPHVGSLHRELQKPSTFRLELVAFIADQLPKWRDRPDRKSATSETVLTSQVCAHLNSAARHSPGWDILQFRVEEPDEIQAGRKIDLAAAPLGTTITIEGRSHTDFDSLMPIECKRLPTPSGPHRDEREYVICRNGTTGGIQRFKEGHHGAAHRIATMIAYVQDGTSEMWATRVDSWISALAGIEPGWTAKDLLELQSRDGTQRLCLLCSCHTRRNGLQPIELRHLWVEMS